MSEGFVCGLCGETHEGLTTDWAYTLPDVVWAIPEDERANRAKFDSDLCMLDSRSFIRCILEVPFSDRAGYFGWGCWAEVDRSVFERYLALYETDGSQEPRHSGRVANALRAYTQTTIDMPVFIQFGQSHERPTLHCSPDNPSELALEQRSGIDFHRHHEIVQLLRSHR